MDVWLPKYYRQNLETDPHPGRVAIQNQIIGGSRLHKEFWQTGQMSSGCEIPLLVDKLYWIVPFIMLGIKSNRIPINQAVEFNERGILNTAQM